MQARSLENPAPAPNPSSFERLDFLRLFGSYVSAIARLTASQASNTNAPDVEPRSPLRVVFDLFESWCSPGGALQTQVYGNGSLLSVQSACNGETGVLDCRYLSRTGNPLDAGPCGFTEEDVAGSLFTLSQEPVLAPSYGLDVCLDPNVIEVFSSEPVTAYTTAAALPPTVQISLGTFGALVSLETVTQGGAAVVGCMGSASGLGAAVAVLDCRPSGRSASSPADVPDVIDACTVGLGDVLRDGNVTAALVVLPLDLTKDGGAIAQSADLVAELIRTNQTGGVLVDPYFGEPPATGPDGAANIAILVSFATTISQQILLGPGAPRIPLGVVLGDGLQECQAPPSPTLASSAGGVDIGDGEASAQGLLYSGTSDGTLYAQLSRLYGLAPLLVHPSGIGFVPDEERCGYAVPDYVFAVPVSQTLTGACAALNGDRSATFGSLTFNAKRVGTTAVLAGLPPSAQPKDLLGLLGLLGLIPLGAAILCLAGCCIYCYRKRKKQRLDEELTSGPPALPESGAETSVSVGAALVFAGAGAWLWRRLAAGPSQGDHGVTGSDDLPSADMTMHSTDVILPTFDGAGPTVGEPVDGSGSGFSGDEHASSSHASLAALIPREGADSLVTDPESRV